jgi:DNA-binding transcriptional regulator GbsR (MarR family)
MPDRSVNRFIEQLGLIAEADGLPRIAGRMFALILLAEAPLSLDEIAAKLGVSKASASTDARVLLRHGWLRRTVQPGDRRDYYELVPDFFAEFVAYRVKQWQSLYDLVGNALTHVPDFSDSGRERLEYLRNVQEFFLKGLQSRLDEWHAHHRPTSLGHRTPLHAAR